MAETDWGNIIRLLGAVGGLGGGIAQAFRKEPQPYGIAEAAQAAGNANTYMAASADPNSQYFRNISGLEEQRNRTDLISSVDRIMREIASRGATGRGTINPERRDETIWGILAKGFQDAGMKARETARQQLLNMAGGQQRNAASFGSLVQPSMLMQLFNRQNRNTGFGAASQGIMRLGEMIGKPKQGTKEFGVSSVPDMYGGAYQER
jgi:hypothetical protein